MSTQADDALDQITEVAARQTSQLKALAYRALAARGMRPSREDVEDVLSEAYLDAARRCERDPPQLRNAEAWFRRVVFHRCLHVLRGRAKDPVDLAALEELTEDSAFQLEMETWDPGRKILASQLASLAEPLDRQILQRVACGWTSREIGEAVGLSAAAVRQRLSRATQSLRQHAT